MNYILYSRHIISPTNKCLRISESCEDASYKTEPQPEPSSSPEMAALDLGPTTEVVRGHQQEVRGHHQPETGRDAAGFRTLAARKAYDEPLDISIQRKAEESYQSRRWVEERP